MSGGNQEIDSFINPNKIEMEIWTACAEAEG